MSTLTIRNVDDGLKRALRLQAAANDRSMEEEVRTALRNWVADARLPGGGGMGTRLREAFEAAGRVELRIPERGPARPLPDYFKP